MWDFPFSICICEKWDPRPGTFVGTRDSRPGTHLVGETGNPRPETLKVGPETQDPGPNSKAGLGTRDPRPGTLILHGTQDTETQDTERPEAQNKHFLSNLGRKNYDSTELNQIFYK